MAGEPKYASWTKSSLIERVQALEEQLRSAGVDLEPWNSKAETTGEQAGDTSTSRPGSPSTKPKPKRAIDPSKYATRFVALKLAYLGKNYGGYEFQAAGNVETIEEHLWKALVKAHLIFPKDPNIVDFSCCEYSKCGRTDKGVSAFGQVIGLRLKSNRPMARKRVKIEGEEVAREGQETGEVDGGEMDIDSGWDHIRDELQYARILNRLLPPDIRILAWCPEPPPEFSARFSCRERQYRYFFTQPAFAPENSISSSAFSGSSAPPVGWLDIEAMRDAAKRFEGEHDFRNFCKIDPAKLLTAWTREIFEVSIEEVPNVSSALPYLQSQPIYPAGTPPEGHPKVYSFNVKGSAFLWHQIRHMIGVLFLVGQGFEKPEIVTKMLDVASNPRKPNFAMADEVPLVLWDCIFPKDGDRTKEVTESLEWVGAEETASLRFSELVDSVWGDWREKKMDELLANRLLQEVATQHISRQGSEISKAATEALNGKKKKKDKPSHRAFTGGNGASPGGPYIPLLKRQLLEEPHVQVEKFARKKGYKDADDMRRAKGYRTGTDGDE
ncbi:pseudouridine synthase [Sarocladium strictum]